MRHFRIVRKLNEVFPLFFVQARVIWMQRPFGQEAHHLFWLRVTCHDVSFLQKGLSEWSIGVHSYSWSVDKLNYPDNEAVSRLRRISASRDIREKKKA